MGNLMDWAGPDKTGYWHKFDEDGELIGEYTGFSLQKGKYGEAPVYTFIGEDGETIKLQSSSKKLARKMDVIEVGSMVKVNRTGYGERTSYNVEVVNVQA